MRKSDHCLIVGVISIGSTTARKRFHGAMLHWLLNDERLSENPKTLKSISRHSANDCGVTKESILPLNNAFNFQALTPAVVLSLAPHKDPDLLVNGLSSAGLSAGQSGSVKRPPDIDGSGFPAPPKKKVRRKQQTVDKQRPLLANGASPSLAPMLSPAPVVPVVEIRASTPVVVDQHHRVDDEIPDLFCHDSFVAPSPPLHLDTNAKSPTTKNGAYMKKTRLIFDSGIRKFQQINHDTMTDAVQQFQGLPEFRKPTVEPRTPIASGAITKEVKKPRRPRQPRAKPAVPRVLKPKKAKAVITTTRVVPISLQLKHSETDEQRKDRLLRLANKWSSLPEDSLQWLAATKSVNQLKIIRWLRLVDRAFLQANAARNAEKMERLRDSKIHAVMDLEKMQAPFEPRLSHFVHPQDMEKKNLLVKRFFAGEVLSYIEIRWLKEHYDGLCEAEKSLTVDITDNTAGSSADKDVSNAADINDKSDSVAGMAGEQNGFGTVPSTSQCGSLEISKGVGKNRFSLVPLDLGSICNTHHFIRKFPDSTRGLVEVRPDGMPCAVLLLFQLPNTKAVHIKKHLKEPDGGFKSKETAFEAAKLLLSHLVTKYLSLPNYPVYVRFPLSSGYINDYLKDSSPANCSRWNFNRDIRGWETIHYVDAVDSATVPSDLDSRLPNELVRPSTSQTSLVQDYRQVFPSCLTERDKPYEKLDKQVRSKRAIDLTAMANDPTGNRRWLSWECRHLSQQYFELDACQQLRERTIVDTIELMTKNCLPEKTLARAAQLLELTKDGIKKPKSSTVVITKTIKIGEQVKYVLESYKNQRTTRRKKAAAAAVAQSELLMR